MYIGIISDTHDNVEAVKKAVDVFEERGVDVVLHCGDFIAPPVIPFFDGFELHGVLGNNDGEIDGLETSFESLGSGSELHGRFADLDFGEKRFRMLHGENKDDVKAYARSGEYDYVLYGHYHTKEDKTVDGTRIINPGGHFPTVPEDHRTVALLDTESDDVEFVNLERF